MYIPLLVLLVNRVYLLSHGGLQTNSFFVINVNAILTMQFRPNAGQSDQLTSMRPELQSQNHVDVCYGKTVGLGAWLTKALWKSNISLCLSQKEKSLTPKLTK